MINIMYAVDPIKRIVKPMSGHAVTEQDHEASSLRFAFPDNIAGTGLDSTGTAVRVMYIRPDGGDPVAKTLTFYKHSGGYYLYDWDLQKSDLQKEGRLVFSLCILNIVEGDVEEWHTTPCQIRVLDTIHTDDSDEGDETITPTVAQRVAVLETMIQRVASGAPIVVSSASAMTDTDQIYVLSTNGRWYYHNGTAWTVGGEYGGVADGSVTTDKLADGAVTTAKIADGAITKAKLSSDIDFDVETDATLTQSGVPADAKKTGDELTAIKADLSHKTGLSEEAKVAILDCFEHVAWTDEHGQTYYDNLYDALYPDSDLIRIEATFSQGSAVVYSTTPLNNLKAYLTVTGYYNDGTSGRITDYALSGTLTEGISTITVTAEGRTTTFIVNVAAEWGDDYTWLYNPSDDGLLSGRTDIVATTIGTGCVESLNDGILNLYVPENTNQIIRYNLNQSTNSNAKMTAKVRFKDVPIVTGAAGFRLQVSNGVSGTQIMEHRLRNQDPVFAYYESGNAILLNDIVTFDEWHIISVELNNNKQTITVDGVKVMESSTLSTNYCTLNSIIAQNVVDASNEHELDVDVAWITYKNND